MRKSRFSEEQITKILAESRAGANTAELCRKYGVSTHTFYKWREKFGSLQGTEVRRMKEMEAKIARLEKIVAKQAVELQAAEEIIKGKW
jgi:putative transposase